MSKHANNPHRPGKQRQRMGGIKSNRLVIIGKSDGIARAVTTWPYQRLKDGEQKSVPGMILDGKKLAA